MANYKPFRELIPPGTNFEFIGRRRLWVTLSALFCGASLALLFINHKTRGSMLNWTIDFRGGTEVIFEFSGEKKIGVGDVRTALLGAGIGGAEVSDFAWSKKDAAGQSVQANGVRVRTPEFGAMSEAEADAHKVAFDQKFKDRELLKLSWSGEVLHVRSKRAIAEAEAEAFFKGIGLELRPWGDAAADYVVPAESTGEYNLQFAVRGLDAQYQKVLGDAFAGTKVDVVQIYAVGPKAGAQLRNDGIKSLFYAMALIMLYLAFRFDVRYAPGAVLALLHDALLVVGVFALTWTDFSLTTVAALLTVIGYSVNDTVIIFDRVRENVGRLKDKKYERIMNISLNETLGRTILTSSTLLIVTLMMNLLGTGLVRNFAFAMNIGVIVGTYSSIFIASPIALWIHNRYYAGKAPAATAQEG
jgi:preprotein translocase subunit SecF